MNLLLDTHILLWSAGPDEKLSRKARDLLEDKGNRILFSAISLFEVAIKASLDRPDFRVDPVSFRRNLLANDMEELAFTGEHGIAVHSLPRHHSDPFDRALIAQAIVDQVTLITSDKAFAAYPGPILLV